MIRRLKKFANRQKLKTYYKSALVTMFFIQTGES